jgi:hypothetical protein
MPFTLHLSPFTLHPSPFTLTNCRTQLHQQKVLKDRDVLQYLTIGEYHLDLIPFDNDVLTLELESAFRDCCLEGRLDSYSPSLYQ